MTCTSCKKQEGDGQKMMCKKKWFALLTVFIIYILLGASFFYKVENNEEHKRRVNAERERKDIKDTLFNLLNDTHPDQLNNIVEEISDYCNKPILDPDPSPLIWDYYHSVFFSITVVTTIGYGNLAPTTSWSRIFMIVYGLIGIPVNGILFATLGDYFGKTFTNIYRKWKNNRVKNYADNLSLLSRIILYLIPGLIIFLFLPAIVIQHFEDWDYVLSVYYAFVTLTTIGFGDYVAGVTNKGFNEMHFVIYQIFLVIWIIFGLGYLVMVIGFLTRGLRSKKMAKLEKHLTHNIKTTHNKIWTGLVKDFTYLRRIMNELYMAKFKPVYHDDYSSTTPRKVGSQSFPDLRKLIQVDLSPKPSRRRAFSECLTSRPLTRVQSDTDLHRIDKEATFAGFGLVQPSELLANVATALTKSTFNEPLSESDDEAGYHGFSDSEILASELYGSGWTLGDVPMQPPKSPRCRAASEVKIPMKYQQDMNADWTWSGPLATQKIQELRQRTKYNRARVKNNQNNSSKSLFDKIKSTWSKTVDEGLNKQIDVEKQVPQPWDNTVNSNNTIYSQHSQYSQNTQTSQRSQRSQRSGSIFTIEQERYMNRTKGGRVSVFSVPETRAIMEETSVADLLRALTSIHSRVAGMTEGIPEPKRKFGTATPPKEPSILELFNPPGLQTLQIPSQTPSQPSRAPRPPVMARRASAIPSTSTPTRRRFSLHPVSEDQLMIPPPPYSAANSSVPPPQIGRGSPTPPPNLVHKQVQRLRGPVNRILNTRTRHNSLTDVSRIYRT